MGIFGNFALKKKFCWGVDRQLYWFPRSSSPFLFRSWTEWETLSLSLKLVGPWIIKVWAWEVRSAREFGTSSWLFSRQYSCSRPSGRWFKYFSETVFFVDFGIYLLIVVVETHLEDTNILHSMKQPAFHYVNIVLLIPIFFIFTCFSPKIPTISFLPTKGTDRRKTPPTEDCQHKMKHFNTAPISKCSDISAKIWPASQIFLFCLSVSS